jgi:hypothetical protein
MRRPRRAATAPSLLPNCWYGACACGDDCAPGRDCGCVSMWTQSGDRASDDADEDSENTRECFRAAWAATAQLCDWALLVVDRVIRILEARTKYVLCCVTGASCRVADGVTIARVGLARTRLPCRCPWSRSCSCCSLKCRRSCTSRRVIAAAAAAPPSLAAPLLTPRLSVACAGRAEVRRLALVCIAARVGERGSAGGSRFAPRHCSRQRAVLLPVDAAVCGCR